MDTLPRPRIRRNVYVEVSGSISTKEIPIKGISPASTRCRGNPARLHACAHAHALARVCMHVHALNIQTHAYPSPNRECALMYAISHVEKEKWSRWRSEDDDEDDDDGTHTYVTHTVISATVIPRGVSPTK